MIPAHPLLPLAFAFAAPVFAAQPAIGDDPQFAVVLQSAAVEFHIEQAQSPFLGIVLVSLSPNLQHFAAGLPPLLEQSIVFDWGPGQDGEFAKHFPDTLFPAGVMIYAQGVTISDVGIQSSNVGSFVLDLTGEGGR